MTTTRETADHAELAANAHIRNLRLAASRDFAVSGYSDGLIVEQDMRGMLLAAAEAFDALLSEIAALRGDLAKTGRDYSELRDSFDAVVAKLTIERDHGAKQSVRATQAERQRDEAVGLLRDHDDVTRAWDIEPEPGSVSARARAFLANQGADQ